MSHRRGIPKEESQRRKPGRGILEKDSFRRDPGGGMMEEEFWKRKILQENPKKSHPRGIVQE